MVRVCPNGHEIRGANLYICSTGYVKCRICKNEASKRARAKVKQQKEFKK